jgi:uncharacterized protein YkwD
MNNTNPPAPKLLTHTGATLMLYQPEFIHAAKVCANLEADLTAAAARTQRAIRVAQAELQHMMDILNDGRAARGLPPLDVTLEAVQ